MVDINEFTGFHSRHILPLHPFVLNPRTPTSSTAKKKTSSVRLSVGCSVGSGWPVFSAVPTPYIQSSRGSMELTSRAQPSRIHTQHNNNRSGPRVDLRQQRDQFPESSPSSDPPRPLSSCVLSSCIWCPPEEPAFQAHNTNASHARHQDER